MYSCPALKQSSLQWRLRLPMEFHWERIYSYQNLLYYNGIHTIWHRQWFPARNCNFYTFLFLKLLTGVALTDWQVLIVLMIVIIHLEINWHNLSTLTEWEVENFEQRRKKNGCRNKAIKAYKQRSNCPHGSLIIHQTFQRAMWKGQWQSMSLPG